VLTDPPLEYPRTTLPESVRMVGGQPWDPPAETPEWLLEPGDPWVLVTCSTDYLADERLATTAVQALRDEPVRVLVTLADAYDGARLPDAPNVRVERFLSHAAVLPHVEVARCVQQAGTGVVLAAKELSADRLRDAVARVRHRRRGGSGPAPGGPPARTCAAASAADPPAAADHPLTQRDPAARTA
jgi:UDP:flavonoid glycosyltransferase YjiC (YdhE family)